MGDSNYIFISYAHKSKAAKEVIDEIINRGFNVWYDDGIDSVSSDFESVIIPKLKESRIVACLIDPYFASSENCLDELAFAKEERKEIVPIILEEFPLPDELRSRIIRNQHVLKYKYGDEGKDRFYSYLLSSKAFEDCRDDNDVREASFCVPKQMEENMIEIHDITEGRDYKGECTLIRSHEYELRYKYRNYADSKYNSGESGYSAVALESEAMISLPLIIPAKEKNILSVRITARNFDNTKIIHCGTQTVLSSGKESIEIKPIDSEWIVVRKGQINTVVYIGKVMGGEQGEVVFRFRTDTPKVIDQYGWGPERKTFTMSQPSPYPTFNSIRDNNAVGDERNFVRIIENDHPGSYRDAVILKPGREYKVAVFYMNDCGLNINAEGVKVAAHFTKELKQGEMGGVSVVIKASNTDPEMIWDGASFYAGEDVNIRFKEGSAVIYNDRRTNKMHLPDSIISSEGVMIGADALDGIVPCDNEHHGRIVFILCVDPA